MTRKMRCTLAGAALALVAGGCGGDGIGPEPPPGFVYASVSAGGEHSCGVSPDGALFCWGRGDLGALGDGLMGTAIVPVRVDLGRAALEVSAGFAHTCALTDQHLHCWGWNRYGQLGLGGTGDAGTPVVVSPDTDWAMVSAGWNHTCALDADGRAFCWGANGVGQLGDGTTIDALEPVPADTAHRFTAISAGAEHTCAVTVAGAGRCWGLNHRGQLGSGSAAASPEPVDVAGGHRFSAISAGYSHTCGLLDNRSIRCWGDNQWGELGIGFVTRPGQPGAVSPVEPIRPARAQQVSAGYHYSCAVDLAGTGWCWGRGVDFQLGLGTDLHWTVPQRILDRDIRWAAISTGGLRHTCGVSEHGGAYCWGIGEHGQLGNTSVWTSPVPVRVSGGQAR